jgi:hypothetical protein
MASPSRFNVKGYDRLGQMMGDHSELAIFRRFAAISAEDLLYRQAELLRPERRLRKYQKEDKASGHPDRQRYSLTWDILEHSVDDDAGDGDNPQQWETVLEIRGKMQEYCELSRSIHLAFHRLTAIR